MFHAHDMKNKRRIDLRTEKKKKIYITHVIEPRVLDRSGFENKIQNKMNF